MQTMTLSFGIDGSVEHTLKDGFFKLDGRREIERVSEILFNERVQMFYIKWLLGPWAGQTAKLHMSLDYGVDHDCRDILRDGGTMLFGSYEKAVGHEVAMLNAMRKAGVTFQ